MYVCMYVCMHVYVATYILYTCRTVASEITRKSGCKGSYPFMKLSQHDPQQQTMPDAMHTIKDAIANIYDLIIGKDDTIKCRRCELNYGRSFGIVASTLEVKINRKQPGVSYTLSSGDIKLADSRAETIITPLHIDYICGQIFSKTSHLKSHDWKQVAMYVHN